jgi:endonuclease/exonuclease/phosphatase (EEP) superfamily protein YafD
MADAETSLRSRWRGVVRVLAAVALIALAIPVAARLFGIEEGPLAILVALMPWVTAACAIPVLLALLARAWILLAASAAVMALCVAWAVPMFTSQDAYGDDVVNVATVNLTFGRADADAVVALVERHEVDVLAAQEVTPEVVAALSAAGLDDLLPYSEVAAEPGVTGTALWSRMPLANAESLEGNAQTEAIGGYVSRAVRGDVSVAGTNLAVLAVHPAAPGVFGHAAWDADMAYLTDNLAAQDGPTLVVGDFNTTRDHRAFRDIQDLGYADAADQAGAGFLPTFPEGAKTGPLVAIDHALMGHADLVATTVATAEVPGADHRMLLVTYTHG